MPRAALLPVLTVLLASGSAGAQEAYTGLRPLGTGGAMRASAAGDAGPMLNPSGMSLLRAYSLEAGYQLGVQDATHGVHAAAIDSTSGINLAGGLTYTFVHAAPDAAPSRSGHEVRLALSFPFLDKVYVGATGKYLLFSGAQASRGLTIDAGVTIRPVPSLAVAFVAYNLRELDLPEARRSLGYGASFGAGDLLLVADGVTVLASEATGNAARTSVMGGVEYLQARKVGLRAGGGRNGVSERVYLSAGLSGVSEAGALDLGVQQDITGDGKRTVLAVGARLFIPQM